MKKGVFARRCIYWILICIFLFGGRAQAQESQLQRGFLTPPDAARPRVYWFWIYNRVTKEGITRDLQEFRAKGISGVNLICNGGYAGLEPLPGLDFLGEEWRALFRHAIREAKRLHIEIGFNLAGGWTFMGPSVTPDDAMKKIVFASVKLEGGKPFSGSIPRPEMVADYYHDIIVQAFPLPVDTTMPVDRSRIIDLTSSMDRSGHITWTPPPGQWVVLRSGYTLTGHPWSKWKAYPDGDTFKGGDGYEIDYLSRSALDHYFDHLGKTVIAEATKAGGKIDYLWADSWECGKLTWTQNFFRDFLKYRGYDAAGWLPALAGYTVGSADLSARFRNDFDRTIQDCIADNCYGHFAELCHRYGMKAGSEAGGPNDIPPQDVLKNFSTNDIVSGEFWVNGHRNAPGGYNRDRMERLNLKQTAAAAHVYGKRQAEAEAFTEQAKNATHWTLGPSDLKPYANDAFCEGINRLMLHSATSQPPSDGKPGYEYCAGTHFTPNITWWERSPAFFSYLSRCQYMLQQGRFVGDVCFYLGEKPPFLVPPKYTIPALGPGYDCDYINPDALLTRMAVRNGRLCLPDGMTYRLLVLQNCVSPSPAIAKEVANYQQLPVSSTPDNRMSLGVIKKLRSLINEGATVVGPPPTEGSGVATDDDDAAVRTLAAELWGGLDGVTKTEHRVGKGRVIWGKTPREVLAADGVLPDFSVGGLPDYYDSFDYIHRSAADAEIYFVINRTDQRRTEDFRFRVNGRLPAVWDPLTGKGFAAVRFSRSADGTVLPMTLEPFGSYFIVFRKEATDKKGDFPQLRPAQELAGSWKVAFDTAWGGPAAVEFPSLVSWTQRTEEGIRYYSGTAKYSKMFDLDGTLKAAGRSPLYLDLGDVKNVAAVRLNGKELGVLWCAPWRVDISSAVNARGNVLEIEVINLWCNRVVHDLSLPVAQRITKTHEAFRFDMLNVNTPVLGSGLLGPVKIFVGN